MGQDSVMFYVSGELSHSSAHDSTCAEQSLLPPSAPAVNVARLSDHVVCHTVRLSLPSFYKHNNGTEIWELICCSKKVLKCNIYYDFPRKLNDKMTDC